MAALSDEPGTLKFVHTYGAGLLSGGEARMFAREVIPVLRAQR